MAYRLAVLALLSLRVLGVIAAVDVSQWLNSAIGQIANKSAAIRRRGRAQVPADDTQP